MPIDSWDDERVATLSKMWAEGYSATRIAAALECSRNSIIGKVNRLKLPPPAEKLPVIKDMSYARQLPEVTLKKRRLRENLYALGRKFTPAETIERVVGGPINPQPYLRYLRDKLTLAAA